MPCLSQQNRMQDKRIAWMNADIDFRAAEATAATATVFWITACTATAFYPPVGSVCAVAFAGFVGAVAVMKAAQEKRQLASEAYSSARHDYNECLATLSPASP